jgi:hypothetical protein
MTGPRAWKRWPRLMHAGRLPFYARSGSSCGHRPRFGHLTPCPFDPLLRGYGVPYTKPVGRHTARNRNSVAVHSYPMTSIIIDSWA